MKTRYHIILLLFLPFFLVGNSEAASLRVFCNEDNAKVYVEDNLIGITAGNQRTPLLIQDLDVGSYNLKAVKEGFGLFERKVTIRKGRPNSIEVILRRIPKTGTIRVVFRYTGHIDSDYVKLFSATADPGGSSLKWYMTPGGDLFLDGRDEYGTWNRWEFIIANSKKCIYEKEDVRPGIHSLNLSFYVSQVYVGDIREEARGASKWAALRIDAKFRKRIHGNDSRYKYEDLLTMSGYKYEIEVLAGKATLCFVDFDGYDKNIYTEFRP